MHEAACAGNLKLPGWPDFQTVLSDLKALKAGGPSKGMGKDM